MESFEHNGYTIKVERDEHVDPPREDFAWGKMICFHSRHTLGDKHSYNSDHYNGWDAMEKAIIKEEDPAVILPLYMYDHSGLVIATEPFDCPWDSGRIGFILVTKNQLHEEGRLNKRLTQKLKDEAKRILEGEVKTYNQYLSGDVWYYTITDKEGKEVDSCYGMYGEDYCRATALQNCPEAVAVIEDALANK